MSPSREHVVDLLDDYLHDLVSPDAGDRIEFVEVGIQVQSWIFTGGNNQGRGSQVDRFVIQRDNVRKLRDAGVSFVSLHKRL